MRVVRLHNTLSLLASMLIESGVVQEGEPVVSTTYGRPSTPLEIRGGSIAGIGLQINTDGYGCLALDLNGDTLGREWVSEDTKTRTEGKRQGRGLPRTLICSSALISA